MIDVQAIGALIFGALTLAVLAALALLSGDTVAVLAIVAATTTAYAAQLCYYWYGLTRHDHFTLYGNVFWFTCLGSAALSLLLSIWI